MNVFRAVLATIIAIVIVLVLNTRMDKVPPVGKFLDPYSGFWQNAEDPNATLSATLAIKGLHNDVHIAFDDKRIPHIFAKDDHDLYMAQGYFTARDRLWQMDVQTRLASGRLSEVLGPDLLETDRFQRRMGMQFGAENMMKEVEGNPKLKQVMEAYADGVNAWISGLSPSDYPIEFKVLDYRPEPWRSINSALLLKMMSSTLAGGSDEFYMSNILKKFGAADTRDLFPDYPFTSDPIIPVGTKWDFKPLTAPLTPNDSEVHTSYMDIHTRQRPENIGSNNWALAGAKTVSGYPILANDPHLDLTLPAIWYQVQLAAPGVNVNGVSIPGAPCVIIGYNQQVAWGVTNVGSDVLDWYRIRFKDAAKREYWYEGHWKKTISRIERITVRGGRTVLDTVHYTHHGPVVYETKQKPAFFKAYVPEGHALRWIAHDRSADIETFYLLNRAKNYTDYRKALTWYTAPAQNFAFADVENDISITPNGKFPLKWKGQGKFLLDGSKAVNEWHGFIPADQNPTVKNPSRGFVSSANQASTDSSYPYYLNWDFAPYERGHRINTRLGTMKNATADSMRALQNDTYSVLAENILPVMLAAVDREKLDASENEAFAILKNWKRFYQPNEIAPAIFELWQTNLIHRTWDEFADDKMPMRQPPRERTVQLLLHEPGSKWFDNISTPGRETMKDMVNGSFRFAVDSLERKHGPIGRKWEWGNVKESHVPHLAGLPGFGSKILYVGGGKSIINATSNKNGPSWRMVVALGKPTKGYGVFPGGESGNPGSYYYDNMIGTWAAGRLNELVFLTTPGEKNRSVKERMTLTVKSN